MVKSSKKTFKIGKDSIGGVFNTRIGGGHVNMNYRKNVDDLIGVEYKTIFSIERDSRDLCLEFIEKYLDVHYTNKVMDYIETKISLNSLK